MKIYLKKLSYLLLAFAFLLGSCETEESLTITTPDAEFRLDIPGISNIFLNFALPDNPAFRLTWDDQLSTGATYTIEMATDAEFTNSVVLGTTTESGFSMTVMQFNEVLKSLGITSYEKVTVFFRIDNGTQKSNVVLYQVTTYAVAVPEITSPDNTFAATLSDVDPEAVAMTIEFNDPELGPNNTATVNYEVEMALAGTSFAQAYSLGTTTNANPQVEVTHGAVNEFVLAAGINPGDAGSFDLRVVAKVNNGSGDLIRTSEAVTISITPYNVALAPVLYVVGAGAVDAGWDWASPVELVLQGKTYSGNINLINDTFRFFTVKDDWGSGQNFPWYVDRGYTIDSNFENANDGDSNFRFIGTPGQYFIEINTQTETITLGPPRVGPNCNFDQLWVVGAGAVDAGWDWANPIQISCTGTGVYEGNINLTNDAFRFFTEKDNWGSGRNYPYYNDDGYTIDSRLENANDGDSNFKFNGTPGEYGLTVDTVNKTITLSDPISFCEFNQLWLVGAATPGGWDWAAPTALPCVGKGLYSGDVTLTNEAFRFFTEKDNWGSGLNYPHYENDGYSIDANFENANDGDSNFRFIGTPGTFKLTVDTINKRIYIGQGCSLDQLWLVGAATPGGWDWAAPTALPCTGFGVYSGQVTLTNEAFRFFTERDNWGSGLNYPHYEGEGYSIDSNFENANDGDSNFRFIGTAGTYTLKVDTVNKTITLN